MCLFLNTVLTLKDPKEEIKYTIDTRIVNLYNNQHNMETKQPDVKKKKTPVITKSMMEQYMHRSKPVEGIPKEYYQYIQCANRMICYMISQAIEAKLKEGKRNIRILDVGSGTGGAILLMEGVAAQIKKTSKMRGISFAFEGIEIDPVLVTIADEQNIFTREGDALKYKKYNEYDIVYFYHPIADHKLMKKLEEKIEKEIAPETIIVAPLKTTDDVEGQNWCKRKINKPKGWEEIPKSKKMFLHSNAIIIKKPKKTTTRTKATA